MNISHPTPYGELNAVLHELVTSVQSILGATFTGAYLQGSFAVGDFDTDSDVDWLVVVEDDVSEAQLAALQTLHARIYDLPSTWAQHLDGSYLPKAVLKQPVPAGEQGLYLDNGSRELIRSSHDNTVVVRWTVREHGITLAGPDPQRLIDPVSARDLRHEVSVKMRAWADEVFADPDAMNNRWYQPYAVLGYCRMLHTLQTGTVGSKPAAARWAKEALNSRWAPLIQRAWDERPDPSLKSRQPADPDDFQRTLEFIHYALTRQERDATHR
jgi:predicted nucleotidyltransferase